MTKCTLTVIAAVLNLQPMKATSNVRIADASIQRKMNTSNDTDGTEKGEIHMNKRKHLYLRYLESLNVMQEYLYILVESRDKKSDEEATYVKEQIMRAYHASEALMRMMLKKGIIKNLPDKKIRKIKNNIKYKIQQERRVQKERQSSPVTPVDEMNPVRQRILLDVNQSLRQYPYHKHPDIVMISVSAEWFDDIEDEQDDIKPDFNEVIVGIDKKWLWKQMKSEGITKPRAYLVNNYTNDDSGNWFDEANRNQKIAYIGFN